MNLNIQPIIDNEALIHIDQGRAARFDHLLSLASKHIYCSCIIDTSDEPKMIGDNPITIKPLDQFDVSRVMNELVLRGIIE